MYQNKKKFNYKTHHLGQYHSVKNAMIRLDSTVNLQIQLQKNKDLNLKYHKV